MRNVFWQQAVFYVNAAIRMAPLWVTNRTVFWTLGSGGLNQLDETEKEMYRTPSNFSDFLLLQDARKACADATLAQVRISEFNRN